MDLKLACSKIRGEMLFLVWAGIGSGLNSASLKKTWGWPLASSFLPKRRFSRSETDLGLEFRFSLVPEILSLKSVLQWGRREEALTNHNV